MKKHKNGYFYITKNRQSQTKPDTPALHRLKSTLTACKAEKKGINKQLNQIKSEKDEIDSQLKKCNRESRSKQFQIDRLESDNEKLETSIERCTGKLN